LVVLPFEYIRTYRLDALGIEEPALGHLDVLLVLADARPELLSWSLLKTVCTPFRKSLLSETWTMTSR